jgi:serine phosphatase RsbU (regulator of sigma subunit)/tetratricopeptide (TPR) repeat protein
VLFLSTNTLWAQNIDSLKLELANSKEDTTKVNILMQLVESISDDNVWPAYNEQMLKISEKIVQSKIAIIRRKGKKGLADAYNNIGYMYNNQGDIPNALDFFGKSLRMQEELGFKDGVAELLSNIGVIYYMQNDLPKALDYYLKGLKIREEIGDKNAIANSLNNIGNLFYTQKNMQRALYYSNRSLQLQQEIGDKEGMAYSLNNLGGIYFYKNDITKALKFYLKSKAMRLEIGDQQGVAASLHNIATLYLKQSPSLPITKTKQLNLAQCYTDSSLLLSKKLGFPANIRNAEKLYSKIDSAKGNFASAFEHYKLFVLYKDSINNEVNHQASIKSQLKYVFEKKEAILKEQQDKERAIGREKSRLQQLVIWAVVGGLIILAGFSFFIFRSLQQNKKANRIITLQKELVEDKNLIIEEKQKEIIDSINYAKRIQYSLLADEDILKSNLANYFVYFNPKDIVSGDFYWATKKDHKFYMAVCDSTGHGVPGAFMSLLNIGYLSEAINEKGIEKPNEIFNYVRERLIAAISKEGQKDGFDGILVCIDAQTNQISYAAANNKPLLISDYTITELVADRMPVGIGERKEDFALYTISCKPGDCLYLYTDGYADQFGGEKGKKFKYKPLNELILNNHMKKMNEQHDVLNDTFEAWRGKLEQVDDVCVIGIKI